MTTSHLRDLGASREAVQHHYDVGNPFYSLWLDGATLSYTSALFDADDAQDTLERAQIRKLDYHAEQIRADRCSRILDVGCGWGNMLRRLTQEHGVAHTVGLTLSQEQAAYVAAHGDPRIELRIESWVDHNPREPYDAIVSIEAIEAFARHGLPAAEKLRVYRSLFERCHAWLRPGGRMSWQMITYGNSGPEDFDSFIAQEIFPESDLPQLAEIVTAIDRRFELVSLHNHRADYGRTLREWLRRLKANREQAVALVGEDVVVRYERYLRLSAYMFESGTCNLYRITLQRIDRPRPHASPPDTNQEERKQ